MPFKSNAWWKEHYEKFGDPDDSLEDLLKKKRKAREKQEEEDVDKEIKLHPGQVLIPISEVVNQIHIAEQNHDIEKMEYFQKVLREATRRA